MEYFYCWSECEEHSFLVYSFTIREKGMEGEEAQSKGNAWCPKQVQELSSKSPQEGVIF